MAHFCKYRTLTHEAIFGPDRYDDPCALLASGPISGHTAPFCYESAGLSPERDPSAHRRAFEQFNKSVKWHAIPAPENLPLRFLLVANSTAHASGYHLATAEWWIGEGPDDLDQQVMERFIRPPPPGVWQMIQRYDPNLTIRVVILLAIVLIITLPIIFGW